MRPASLFFTAALTALAALVAVPAHAAPYSVFLKDGRVLGARTKPAMVMGQVSFVAERGGIVTLDIGRVDVASTRAALGETPRSAASKVWTARELERVGQGSGSVQVLGTLEATPAEPASDQEQLAMLKGRIQQLEQQLDGLSADDKQAKILLRMQRQLQGEVSRILRSEQDDASREG